MRQFASFQKSTLLLSLVLLCVLCSSLPVAAQKVVLMPVADISKGENGVNLTFTKMIETELKQLGVEQVSRSDVKLFMVANKVRNYRHLDTYLVKKIGTEFGCSMVLLGTITELDESKLKAAITFTALDATNGVPVWSGSLATSLEENPRMLALGEPQSVVELVRPLLQETLAPLIEITAQNEKMERRDYQLLGLELFPGYVQGGQPVKANLKIRFLGERPNLIAVESSVGRSYLQYNIRTDTYQGEWFSPREEGSYKVSLQFEWGRERTVEMLSNVASYEVINQPPGLEIEVKKGITIGQRLAFRDHILILPRIDNMRPMAGWALEIKNQAGDVLVYEEHDGDMPERMVWEGRGSDGFRLVNGAYNLTLDVWDLAGNRSSDSLWVALQASAPQISGAVKVDAGKGVLTLTATGRFEFPLTEWQAELRSKTGKLLVEGQGENLPATLSFLPAADETEVYLDVNGVDMLGNRLKSKRQKLPLAKVKKQIEEKQAESWVQDF